MLPFAIEVKNLKKVFPRKNLTKESFREFLGRKLRGEKIAEQSYVAVENLSFSVPKGEVVGIMGANGSGKSTLLKMLSRILPPTEGEINIKGSVCSILDIGIGLHPDLSGSDNIFFSGALFGLSREEISAKYNQIVEFSELEKHIHVPVKYYSSGMFIRLAFSIIAELDADVILLDEVMAMGDTAFRQKSFKRILNLAEQGKTIVLVSHEPTIITQLCSRCIVMQDAKIVADDSPEKVVAQYLNRQLKLSVDTLSGKFKHQNEHSIKLISVAVLQNGEIIQEASNDKEIEVRMILDNQNAEIFRLALSFRHQLTNEIFSVTPNRNLTKTQCIDHDKGVYEYMLSFPPNYFNQGLFSFDIYLTSQNNQTINRYLTASFFTVNRVAENNDLSNTQMFLGGYSGPLVPYSNWKVNRLNSA